MKNPSFVARANSARVRLAAAIFLVLAWYVAPLRAQTTSTWDGGTGNWSNAASWTPTTVPNNGGAANYDVVIGAPGSVVSMDVLNSSVNNLKLGTGNWLDIVNGDSLSLVSGTSVNKGKIDNAGTFSTAGTLVNRSGGEIMNEPGANFTNNGTLKNYGSVGSEGLMTNNGTLINRGDLGSTGELTNSGTINNKGTMSAWNFGNSGILNNSGTVGFTFSSFGNSGTINNRGSISLTDGIDFGNTGTINNLKDGVFTDANSFGGTNYGKIVNRGTFNVTFGSGLDNATGATLRNSGTLSLSSGHLYNEGLLRNSGSVSVDASSTLFNNAGGTIRDSGSITNDGRFSNAGDVKITKTGTFTTSTDYLQTAGRTIVNGTLTANSGAMVNIQSGLLSGKGTINGNVMMGGSIMPGSFTKPGTLTINGNYSQASTGVFNEMISGKSNGLLNVNGSAALAPGALLNIALLGGFDPKNGTSFTIMDYHSESGIFTIADPYFNHGTQEWVISSYDGGGGDDVVLTAEAARVVTPEPGTIFLVGSGLLALGGYAKKKKLARA